MWGLLLVLYGISQRFMMFCKGRMLETLFVQTAPLKHLFLSLTKVLQIYALLLLRVILLRVGSQKYWQRWNRWGQHWV